MMLIAGGCFGVPSAALAAKHQAKAQRKTQPEAQAPIATCQDEPGLAMLASPMAPWKGAPLRVDLHRGEAARRRAVADRAERKYRGRIRRPAWRARPISGSQKSLRPPRAPGRRCSCAAALRPNAERSRATSWCSAESRRGRSREEASGRCAMPGIVTRRISIRRGSRNCSTRRSTKSCRGARCMTCCGTSRATCSSTPWVCARTRKAKSFSRTAPTFPISCAPISPSRWDCRSAIRNARAATAARRRNARSGGTSRTRSPLPRRPGG